MAPESEEAQPREPDALLRETVKRFVERECSREVVARLEEDPLGYSPEHWRRMAALGWLGLLVPEEYGGSGVGLRELAVIVEACGGAALPSPLFATAIEAASLVVLAGDEAQGRRWLPAITGGEALLAVALLEPGADLDPATVQTRATAAGDGFRLSGTKLFVPYAEAASQLICVARAGEAPQALSMFLVPRGTTDLSLTRLRTSNGDPQYAVTLAGCLVPDSALLGERDGAWRHVETMLDRAAALKCVELVGIGQRALDLTLAFVHERVQFGQPIGKFQAVQHHCADMYRDLEQTRILTARAIWRLASGRPASREVSLAKIKASEAIPALLRMAHQLHGGVGFYADYPLETLYRRSMAAMAAYGPASWHRKKLARLLVTDPDRFRREGAHPLPTSGV